MTDQWWSPAKQDPTAIPFRNKFDNARDPLTARNAIGAVDARYVADAIAAGGGGAPTSAEYITAATDATLTNERVLTNTATVTWDFTTAGQAKANAATSGGNVSNSGTPTVGQYAKWVTATTIQGVAPATVLSDIGAQPAGSYQPLDADLTSLAAATGTNTIYYRSAANTWSPVVVSTGLAFSGGNLTATSAGGNVSNSGTPVAGQVAEWVTATTIAGVSTYAKTANLPAPDHGRFLFSSATACTFGPFAGNKIKINGALFDIPNAGIAGLGNTGVFVNGTGGQNLAASTVYYVYAFSNSGTVTGDFSTTGFATSTAAGNEGVIIKSGDNTRTLIGMVRTIPSSQFQDDAGYRGVISWFNRRNIRIIGAATGGASTASTTFVELTTSSRAHFITWGEECVFIGTNGSGRNSTAGQWSHLDVGLDGATAQYVGTNFGTSAAADYHVGLGGFSAINPAEGYHFITPIGRVSGGTGLFLAACSAVIRG